MTKTSTIARPLFALAAALVAAPLAAQEPLTVTGQPVVQERVSFADLDLRRLVGPADAESAGASRGGPALRAGRGAARGQFGWAWIVVCVGPDLRRTDLLAREAADRGGSAARQGRPATRRRRPSSFPRRGPLDRPIPTLRR